MASLDASQFAGISAAGLGALSLTQFNALMGPGTERVAALTAAQVDELTACGAVRCAA
jgi:hypothetical protein